VRIADFRLPIFDRRRDKRLGALMALAVSSCVAAGCATGSTPADRFDKARLRRNALECLKTAIRYEHNPVVRSEAVEALEAVASEEVRPWIRSALLDEHPGVRFAACMAVGRLRDASAESGLRTRLEDANASVRVAALYALHRLGRTEQTGRLTWYLLYAADATVRRNAAIAIALLDEPSGVKVLARAMKDSDAGVRQHALEGMARLGNKEARQELTFMANSGVGSEEVFALTALAATGDPVYEDTFRYKLVTGTHFETRLAAARGLGKLRHPSPLAKGGLGGALQREGAGGADDEGLAVALEGLKLQRPPRDDPDDPGSDQLLRIHQLAASAAGAIGRAEALPALANLLERSGDPRVQVSASGAVLEVLAADRTRDLPFAPAMPPGLK
jgi:HEAT repeat protein